MLPTDCKIHVFYKWNGLEKTAEWNSSIPKIMHQLNASNEVI